jgi:hypothetical protein
LENLCLILRIGIDPYSVITPTTGFAETNSYFDTPFLKA